MEPNGKRGTRTTEWHRVRFQRLADIRRVIRPRPGAAVRFEGCLAMEATPRCRRPPESDANAANNNALRAFTWISSGDDTSVPSLTPLFLGAIESAPARRRDCSINQRARR